MHQNTCMECLLYSRCHVVYNISNNSSFLWILLFSSFRGLFDLLIDLQQVLFRINTSWYPARTKILAWNACYIPGVFSFLKSIMKDKFIAYEKKYLDLNYSVLVLKEVGNKVLLIFRNFIQVLVVRWLKCRTVKICWRLNLLIFLKTMMEDGIIAFEKDMISVKLFCISIGRGTTKSSTHFWQI